MFVNRFFHSIVLSISDATTGGQPTASLGTDYTVIRTDIDITGESTEVTVFNLIDDIMEEIPEYFEVSLVSVSDGQLVPPETTVFEILDNDGRISLTTNLIDIITTMT